MIFINGDEAELSIMGAKLTFLKVFPLQEIDHHDIQLVCQSYRNYNSTIQSALSYMKRYDEYFYNWHVNNKMCNVFYYERE